MKDVVADTRAGGGTGERAPRRDATENRAAILDSARLLLNRDPETSLEAIAAGAGLSRRAIYGHFATRDDLVTELQVRGSERVIAALQPIDNADSRIAIALIGARLWSEVEDVRVMAQLALRGPQREVFVATLAPVRRKLLAIVQRGIAAGELRSDIPASTLARLIENAALSVLDEAIRADLSNSEGHRLVMLAGLSVAGLSWREAAALIAEHAELGLGETLKNGSAPCETPGTASADPASTPAPAPAPTPTPAAPASHPVEEKTS